jgi:MFS family permease
MLRDFKRILTARFFFTLGVQMQAVVVGWQMYQLTHDPLRLGLIGLAEAVPAIGFALFAGYVVDRSRPLVVLRCLMLASFVSALVVLLGQSEWLPLAPEARVLSLYLASVLTGSARSFSQPSIFAIVLRIVPRDQLTTASAWSMSTMQVARISGPALGGLLFGFAGVQAASSATCVSLVLAITATFAVGAKLHALPGTEKKPIAEELLSGAKFVFTHPILLPALSLDMISVFFGGVTALLPIFASEIIGVGPRGLGFLRAAPAVGAALTGFWLTRADIRARAGAWLFTAVTGFGLSILVFGLSRSFPLSLFALAVSGAFDSVSMVVRSTAVQLASPERMRGRISAVNSIFVGSSNELGEFESGVAASFLGPVPTVLAGAAVCLLTVAGAYALSPALRALHLGRLEEARKSLEA